MDEVKRKAIEHVRDCAGAARKVGSGDVTSPILLLAANMMDRAAEREELGIGATLTLPVGFYDPAVLAAGRDRRDAFRERVILELLRKETTEIQAQTDEQVPAVAALFAKVVVLLADAVVDATYPEKKEPA